MFKKFLFGPCWFAKRDAKAAVIATVRIERKSLNTAHVTAIQHPNVVPAAPATPDHAEMANPAGNSAAMTVQPLIGGIHHGR